MHLDKIILAASGKMWIFERLPVKIMDLD